MEKMKEVDLAKRLVEYLNGTNYEIYQEVECAPGIVDIVLKHSNFIWAVEVKTSFSLQVIGQALTNKPYFHYSSIAVPHVRSSKGSEAGRRICEQWGIGIFEIFKWDVVRESVKAKLNRSALVKYIDLHEYQKDYCEAGSENGKRWTAFNQTVSELENYVRKCPGCKLKDALTNISHHYASLSSAQNSIRQWIRTGLIKTLKIDNGNLMLIDD